jgi:hypothetical protein
MHIASRIRATWLPIPAGIIVGMIAAYVGLGTWAVRVEAWLSRGT